MTVYGEARLREEYLVGAAPLSVTSLERSKLLQANFAFWATESHMSSALPPIFSPKGYFRGLCSCSLSTVASEDMFSNFSAKEYYRFMQFQFSDTTVSVNFFVVSKSLAIVPIT